MLPHKLLAVLRTVHIYSTMLALLAFSFFAVTGLMLNHKSWFGLDEVTAADGTPNASLPSRLADLHRGIGTGPWMTVVSDAGAVLLLVATVTGLLLWLAMPKRRVWGVVWLTVGIAVCAAAAWMASG